MLQEAYEDALKDFIGGIKEFATSREAGFMTVNTATPIEKTLFGGLMEVGVIA